MRLNPRVLLIAEMRSTAPILAIIEATTVHAYSYTTLTYIASRSTCSHIAYICLAHMLGKKKLAILPTRRGEEASSARVAATTP